MITCFACGAPVYTFDRACPKCGYKFTAGDNRYCPNMNFGKCMITGEMCTKGSNYSTCEVKNKADEESEF